MAKYLGFYTISKIVIVISVVSMMGFCFMPESPQYLLSKSRFEEAEKSFKFFRGYRTNETLPIEHSVEFTNLRNAVCKTTQIDSKFSHLFRHLCNFLEISLSSLFQTLKLLFNQLQLKRDLSKQHSLQP